ncbi:CotH kinase family protein [Fluviicola taffensis]|uniref:Spore coat protein CotH n=1 Tax=Fluviicola taffensis (strain DSM 16823 / NCIMB 13979 / RW262) TaxID=755732 RepID=F2IJF7_FLUTR|nr:CotH kinase family protein [Fluviicola taffensis]AEA42845.1 Spore coat protein CotH [Fluviicola taffensis DSM 16823]
MKTLLSFLLFALSTISFGQTFNGTSGNIQDNQTLTRQVTVSGLPNSINQASFGLEQVCLDITHTWDADLTVRLEAPDGTLITLFSSIGGDGNNFNTTCLRGDANSSILMENPPFTGVFQAQDALGMMNNNQNPNGIWKLRVFDSESGDNGTLDSWSITFGNNPATHQPFVSSNLPIVIITTNNQSIPDEPKIEAHLKIIDNGLGNTNHVTDFPNGYNNKIGIERRGSSSGAFPQKSYAFETRDINGTTKDTVILGMPIENDWILYAPYVDKTCMRNILTYQLANDMNQYASRTILCELVLNNQYQGIYVAMEKIKRDPNRVAISKLLPTDILGDDLTGGYIIKIDKPTGSNSDSWTSTYQSEDGTNIDFLYHYPKSDEIQPQQKDYIQAYVDSFETALSSTSFADPLIGYRNYSVPETFIDFLILNEISKNVDGYRLSTFIHKEKDSKGGKLRMGPMWDFNFAWLNADYCDADDYTGWQYDYSTACSGGFQIPTWWGRMLEDPWFEKQLKCRWTTLRQTTLSIPTLNSKIDSIANLLNVAEVRHFDKWPILGYYIWPNPSPIPSDYAGEIAAMKSWIFDRTTWIDNNIQGTCDLGFIENEIAGLSIYPNPFTEELHVSWFSAGISNTTIKLFNLNGQEIGSQEKSSTYGINEVKINNLSNTLSGGIYWVEIQEGSSISRIKVVKN